MSFFVDGNRGGRPADYRSWWRRAVSAGRGSMRRRIAGPFEEHYLAENAQNDAIRAGWYNVTLVEELSVPPRPWPPPEPRP